MNFFNYIGICQVEPFRKLTCSESALLQFSAHSAVKEQSAAVGVSGAKANVVAHHDDGHSRGGQAAQNGGQLLLKSHVQALGRLIQQQNPGLQQKNLCQGGPLLLTARQVKGVAAQQMLQAIQAKEKETRDKVNEQKAKALKSRQKDKNW